MEYKKQKMCGKIINFGNIEFEQKNEKKSKIYAYTQGMNCQLWIYQTTFFKTDNSPKYT